MRKIPLICAATLLAGAASAQATVTVAVFFDGLNDASNQAPAAPALTKAIVDRDGDGLAGFDLANWDGSSFLPDSGDWIVEGLVNGVSSQWNETTGDAADGEADFSALVSPAYQISLQDTQGVTAGREVFLFWFPNLPSTALVPGQGQAFGVMSLGLLPSDGGDLTTFSFGTPFPATFTTTSTPIPEPASALFLVGGASMLGLLRRQRRQA